VRRLDVKHLCNSRRRYVAHVALKSGLKVKTSMKDEQPGFDTSVRENDNIRRHIQNSLNVTFSNLGVLRDHLTCLCLGDMLVVI
jgi:hypothetical protein